MKYGREESRLSVLFRDVIAERLGISVTDGECMDFLMDRGSATAGDLAKITGLTTGAITGVIRRLKQSGLITVHVGPDDKRKVIIRPVMEKVKEGIKLYESFNIALNKLYATSSIDELKLIAEYHRKMSDLLADEIKKLNEDHSL